MPELPEVQTIINDLQIIVSDTLTDFVSYWPKAIKNISQQSFVKEIKNQKIKSVSRLGKIILIRLENDKSVAIHLKMTGQLLLMEHGTGKMEQEKRKHLHHIFYLKKYGTLEFYDIRKFATISLLENDNIEKIKSGYGVDPVADNFSSKELSGLLKKNSNRPIKEVLMNNKFILGIGNIYASEILFDAHVLPSKKVFSLTETEIKKIHISIGKILKKAIRLRGTSVSDYRDASGKRGSFQDHLFVYKRHTQKCKRCGTIIERSIISQRSTFYCPNCQQ